MLKFTVNKNNLKEIEEKISVNEITSNGVNINIKTFNSHGLRDGESIIFKRLDINNEVLFNEQFSVNVVDKTNFTIEGFKEQSFSASTCEIVDVYSPLSDKDLKALKIVLNEPSKIITNREEVTNFAVPKEINSFMKRRCKGDLVNFNNIFLLRATNVDANRYIEYEEKYYNTMETVYFKYRNTVITMNILVPLTYNGYDNREVLYWFYNKEDEMNVEYILKHYAEGEFYYEDVRFIKENNNIFNFRCDFSGKTDSYIYQLKNVLDIDINVNEKFNVDLLKNDYYKDFYLDNNINKNINDVIDMEKQIFIPKLEKLDSNCLVNEIKFNLKVRERKEGWNSTVLEDYWYGDEENKMTSITDIGFDENDIKYQKNSLKKSFIRLSFYDTPHRGNQKLLYYSTIFLDSNKIFNDYFVNGKISDLEFIIKNSFDYGACSEGYYLYLFPKFAKKDMPTTIYMKIEFNHAKYGKTITLVLPSDNDYKNGYTNSNTNGTSGIEKLFNDLYIKVNVMYDSINNKYVWYIPDNANNKINDYNNKTITMTLFEPIVYKTN